MSVGTVILLNRKENVVSHKIVSQGRCHTHEIKRGNVTVEIINIYALNKDGEQVLFYRKIQDYLQYRAKTDYLVVVGDFNVVQCQSKNKLFGINVQKKSSRVLNEILTDNNLIDIWRERNPNTRKYT